MKKFLSIVFVTIILVSSFSFLTVGAKNDRYNNIFIAGDSISTGYGLSGDIHSRKSYANILKENLNSDNITNLAVDGYTSSNVKYVVDGSIDKIKNSDLIIMSVGGNDYMIKTGKIINDKYHCGADILSAIQKVFKLSGSEIRETLNSEKAQSEYEKMLKKYEDNLTNILSKIRENNEKAQIVLLSQYNPFSGLGITENIQAMDECVDKEVSKLNSVMKSVAEKYMAHICDVYTLFDNKSLTYTRILKNDIHPNEAGHKYIAENLTELVNSLLPIDNTNPETNDDLCIYAFTFSVSFAAILILCKKKIKKKYFSN